MVASTEGLRPVPHRNAIDRLSKAPKIFWVATLVLVTLLLIWQTQNKPASQIIINQGQDKFKIEVNLEPKDRQRASLILEKLQLPQDVLKGSKFTLDATSSARLAFATPVEFDLDFNKESVLISGQSHIPLVEATLPSPTGFKIPSGAILTVFGSDFKRIITKDLDTENAFSEWVVENVNSNDGQFLMLNENAYFLSFRPRASLDFDKLQKFLDEENYKQETDSDITIHIVKIDQRTLAFFEHGQWAHVTTSLEDAKNMLAVQKGEAPYLNFPKTDPEVSLAVYFKKGESSIDNSLAQIVTGSQKLAKYLENIKEALIILSGEQISGYIDF